MKASMHLPLHPSLNDFETDTDTLFLRRHDHQRAYTIPDLDTVRAFLQEHAPKDISLKDLKLSWFKTYPLHGARLLYKAGSDHTKNKHLYFSARTISHALGHRFEEKINHQFSEVHPKAGFQGFTKAAIYCPKLDLLFQIFPADRRLPFLVNAVDCDFMKSRFAQLFHTNADGRTLADVEVCVIQYKPQRKCLLRYELDWSDRSQKGGARQVLYGKVFRKVHQVHKDLEKIAAAHCGTVFQIPLPLGVLPDLFIQFFGPLPGIHLSRICLEKEFVCICRRVARGLLEFHDTPVILDEERDSDSELSDLEQWSDEFALALPEQAQRIRNLTVQISHRLTHQKSTPLKLVHGDFHVANILVHGGHLGLFDFENCFMGNPAIDVGSFYAQLKLLSLKTYNDHTPLDAAIQEFLEEYTKDSPAVYRYNIPTYCALSCLWCAYFQCLLRPMKPGWSERAFVMLDLAEDILKKGLA